MRTIEECLGLVRPTDRMSKKDNITVYEWFIQTPPCPTCGHLELQEHVTFEISEGEDVGALNDPDPEELSLDQLYGAFSNPLYLKEHRLFRTTK